MTVLEEYCIETPEGRLTKYAGNRTVEVDDGVKVGAQYGETLKLSEPVTIFRGVNRKPVNISKGTRVWRWRTGLGLEPKQPKTTLEK